MVLEHLHITSEAVSAWWNRRWSGDRGKRARRAPWKPGITGKLHLNALQKLTNLKAPEKSQPIKPRDAMEDFFIQQQGKTGLTDKKGRRS
ncbi:MAG: hypothetical protein QGI34_06270 [Candidatus Latescibacteria bacterium]|jgi:hypothetical protein|nr:hypothetical protein [Candidatus Latescibacterota bacterium]